MGQVHILREERRGRGRSRTKEVEGEEEEEEEEEGGGRRRGRRRTEEGEGERRRRKRRRRKRRTKRRRMKGRTRRRGGEGGGWEKWEGERIRRGVGVSDDKFHETSGTASVAPTVSSSRILSTISFSSNSSSSLGPGRH